MRIWKRIIRVEMFFFGQCEKILIPSHNCCCVVRKKNSLGWKWPDRAQGRRLPVSLAWPCSKNDTNLNTDPFYFSFYLLFDLWTAKNWKFYPSNIFCSNLAIIVKLCTCHASLMPLFWQCQMYLRMVRNKCFNRVLGWVYEGLVISTIWHSWW